MTAGRTPLLEITGLRVTLPSEAGPVQAVRGVDLTLARGEVVGIVGESGAGKSVTSLAVMGLLPRTARVEGSIRLDGDELLGLSDREMSRIRGKRIAMVFQDPLSALTPVHSVGDQVAEALTVHGKVRREAAQSRAVELLELVGIPQAARRAGAFPHEFSGGMRQRVVIAMAMANDPDVIVADEPTTALDVTVQAQVLEVLAEARLLTGAAMLLITHDLGIVAGVADRVVVMYAGRAVEEAPVDDLFSHPRMPYTLGLLGAVPRMDLPAGRPLVPIEGEPPSAVDLLAGCSFAPRCPLVVERCREEEPSLIHVTAAQRAACFRTDVVSSAEAAEGDDEDAAGRAAAAVFQVEALPEVVRAGRSGEVLLSVDGLAHRYPVTAGAVLRRRVGEVTAVDGVSFDVRAGETLALVGESGCGKTTTLTRLLELARPQEGRVVVLGRDTGDLTARDRKALRRDLQVVFQDPIGALDPRLPVGEVIAEPLRVHGIATADARRRVTELLQLVGLRPEHANRFPGDFSGGQRQRIGIARALALEPRLVLLDEPVSALDVSVQAGVLDLLKRLQSQLGLGYLFVAHDLSVVRHLAHRVAVMQLGRLVEVGDVEAVFRAPVHPYTQALLSAVPVPDPAKERARTRVLLVGDAPSAVDVPAGCRFRTRCPLHSALSPDEQQRCHTDDPALEPLAGAPDHAAACHFPRVVAAVPTMSSPRPRAQSTRRKDEQ